jgi:hypothetical protein
VFFPTCDIFTQRVDLHNFNNHKTQLEYYSGVKRLFIIQYAANNTISKYFVYFTCQFIHHPAFLELQYFEKKPGIAKFTAATLLFSWWFVLGFLKVEAVCKFNRTF